MIGFLTIFAAMLLAPAPQPATLRSNPIGYRSIVRESPALRMHVITIDLSDPRVELRVVPAADDPDGDGPWTTALRTVREMAKSDDLAIAVNGNFFIPKESRRIMGRQTPYFPGNFARCVGWGVSDGRVWNDGRDARETCELIVHNNGRVSIEQLRGVLPKDAKHIVSGANEVLFDGRITQRRTSRAPRTSVGIDREGTKLTILVADGRRDDWSVGLTEYELGKEMLDLGCWRAINLDGGGSSTLIMRDESTRELKCINRPSDGHDLPIEMSFERNVASVLGVRIKHE